MLKASALYIVIIVAVVIAIFSASLISVAFFYRLEFQKDMRHAKLTENLSSAVALLLSEDSSGKEGKIDLFGEGIDSVEIRRESWGVFELATAKSFAVQDTLRKAFLVGQANLDSSAIYLSDEDRPLSISGDSKIIGDAFLPKAGIKQAYVEGKPYNGSKLVDGKIKDSSRQLPSLNSAIVGELERFFSSTNLGSANQGLSQSNSFFNAAQKIYLTQPYEISGEWRGKIMIISDTLVTIKRDALLKDIIVAAPVIVVESGFKGNCQLFGQDSVSVGKGCEFVYPSCIGVLRKDEEALQPKIELGEDVKFSGILFSFEKERSNLQTAIGLGKGSHIQGEVYACGYIKMNKPLRVDGKVSCNRFIIRTNTTLYENYLIDIAVNAKARSPFFLSSGLFDRQILNRQVLKWVK